MLKYIKDLAEGESLFVANEVVTYASQEGKHFVNQLGRGSTQQSSDKPTRVTRQSGRLVVYMPKGGKTGSILRVTRQQTNSALPFVPVVFMATQ